MTTFSQLVDDMVQETRRPDMLREVVSYANQTLRELHFDPKNEGALFYRDNFSELQLTSTSESGFMWPIPDVTTFQAMQVVKYGIRGVYPPERIPSRALAGLCEYYYRVGSTYVFSGYCGVGDSINIGYFSYTRRLAYYPLATRPAQHDEFGWTYADAFNVSDATRLAAQQLTSNWILLRWRDTVAEGVRAKVYKRVSDTDRARTSYSMYSSMRAELVSGESVSIGGFS